MSCLAEFLQELEIVLLLNSRAKWSVTNSICSIQKRITEHSVAGEDFLKYFSTKTMPVLLDLVLITEVWRLFKEWKENKLCYIFQQGTGGVATLSNCPLKAIKDAVKHSSEMYQQLDPTASHGVMSDLRKSLSSGRRSVLELSSSPCSSDVLRAVTRDNYRDGALSETSEQRSTLEWPG